VTPKRKRLWLLVGSLGVLCVAAALVLTALNDNIVFFYSPSQLADKKPAPDRRLRIGGLVDKPLELTLADLRAMRPTALTRDFQCVTGWRVHHVAWRGVRLGDLLDAAHNLRVGGAGRTLALGRAHIRPIDEMTSQYYLNMEVADRPGVLAAVAGVFAEHGVSIRSMEQDGLGEEARLVFITHSAREKDVQATLHDLRGLDAVDRIGTLLRVVGQE